MHALEQIIDFYLRNNDCDNNKRNTFVNVTIKCKKQQQQPEQKKFVRLKSN